MSRYAYNGVFQDGNGHRISGGTVSVFLAGTTTPASIYTASSGGTAVNSVTSGSNGAYLFYTDTADYSAATAFDLTLAKSGYLTATVYGVYSLGAFPGPIIQAGEAGLPLGVAADESSYSVLTTQVVKIGTDVVSATALTLGEGNAFDITGTTTITSIATKGVGCVVYLQFDGELTLTYHATDLILPNLQDVTTFAGDVGTFLEYAAGKWRCVGYQRLNYLGNLIRGGTWSPALMDQTLSESESQTYTERNGFYYKIGKIVFFQLRLKRNSAGTMTTTEQARISLPVTCGSSQSLPSGAVGYANGLSVTAGVSITWYIAGAVAYMQLWKYSATTGVTALSIAELSTAEIYITGSYAT